MTSKIHVTQTLSPHLTPWPSQNHSPLDKWYGMFLNNIPTRHTYRRNESLNYLFRSSWHECFSSSSFTSHLPPASFGILPILLVISAVRVPKSCSYASKSEDMLYFCFKRLKEGWTVLRYTLLLVSASYWRPRHFRVVSREFVHELFL